MMAVRSSNSQSMTSAQFQDAIRKKAQELYEKSGRKPGRDLDNWLEAERIVKGQKTSR
jgi:hypothetical protein